MWALLAFIIIPELGPEVHILGIGVGHEDTELGALEDHTTCVYQLVTFECLMHDFFKNKNTFKRTMSLDFNPKLLIILQMYGQILK